MFVESVVQSRICVSPQVPDVGGALLGLLAKKYAGRHIPDLGVGIYPTEVVKVEKAAIDKGFIYPLVTFKLLVFRLFAGELLECTVERQDASGVHLTNLMVPDICVPPSLLPHPAEKVSVPTKGGHEKATVWCWTYGDSRLYIKNGDVCRVKVASAPAGAMLNVKATMAADGLGPRSWW